MSLRTALLAGLCSAILMTSAPGCGDGAKATGSQAAPSETHSQRNREMQDFMKNEAQKGAPSK